MTKVLAGLGSRLRLGFSSKLTGGWQNRFLAAVTLPGACFFKSTRRGSPTAQSLTPQVTSWLTPSHLIRDLNYTCKIPSPLPQDVIPGVTSVCCILWLESSSKSSPWSEGGNSRGVWSLGTSSELWSPHLFMSGFLYHLQVILGHLVHQWAKFRSQIQSFYYLCFYSCSYQSPTLLEQDISESHKVLEYLTPW